MLLPFLLCLQWTCAKPFLPGPTRHGQPDHCSPHGPTGQPSHMPNIRPLYQFPNLTWLENLAVRSNGQILVTTVNSSELYQLDPLQHDPTPQVVATFPDAMSLVGVTEIQADVFAVVKGNTSFSAPQDIPGSFSLWKADFRGRLKARISKIVDMPRGQFLNGATTLGKDLVLVSDSAAGVVWRVNTVTSRYNVALNDTTLRPTTSLLRGGFGVNGIHVKNGFLYFTNTNLGFYRVPIHEDGTQAGHFEQVSQVIPGDDFTLDEDGNAYVARGAVDAIDKISPQGKDVSLEFENRDAAMLIEGNTAAQFGRTVHDKSTLYVTTNGGLTGKVNGTYYQGGRVLAIDLGKRPCRA